MKVFVAGGGGAVGARLLPQLIEAGHEVVATARSPKDLARIEATGATGAIMDGLDEGSVLEAVEAARPEVVVHEMTALSGDSDLRHFDRWFATTNELRTRGTDHLLRAAQRVGAGRFVAQSFTGWSNDRSGGPIKTEADALDPDPPTEMQQSLRAIRHLETEVLDAPGLDGVVLRYGSLYGPGTVLSSEYVEMARARKLPIIGDGGGIWSFIHVDDAAAATVAAVSSHTTGIYNIVDDEPAPVSEWLPVLAERSGGKPPRRVPTWIGRLATGEVGVSMMTRIRGASNEKAKRELGWRPAYPTWRDGIGPEVVG